MAVDRWVGQALGGRYQIEELLGAGGMSSVYKARDPNLKRTVAIKLIHPHLSNNEEFVRRFGSEATAIAQLRHQNIVQVYDFNHDGDLYYMVLEYVAGETLQHRIKRMNEAGRRLPMREVLKCAAEICTAADYAHQRGMIHRDIKPANVMLDVNGNAILMDFGIARIMDTQQHTATGAVLGTALYMSPEQIQGLHPDARSDIYSIGVTLFEMLGGRPPFEADSAMTLMMMHLHDPVPDLSQLHPGVPEQVKRIVNRALEKDRANRFQSCAEMAAALQKALSTLGDEAEQAVEAPASQATVIEPAPKASSLKTIVEPAVTLPGARVGEATAVEARAAASEPLPQVSRPPSAKKWVVGGVIAVLLLALAGGGFYAFAQFGPKATPTADRVAGLVSTATALQAALPTETVAPSATTPPTATLEPSPEATFTPAPTDTPEMTPTNTIPPAIVEGGADKIAYLFQNNIWVSNIDGSQVQQVTTDGAAKTYLRWLPDGQSLSYISGKCVQTADLQGAVSTVTCFNNATYVDSFEVSPDGARVALSVDRQLYLLPYDLASLATADTHPDLAALGDCPAMAPYQRNAVVSARWSKDGKSIAAITVGVLEDGRRGEIVNVFDVDGCVDNPYIKVQFPQPHFTFGAYNRNPTLAGFTWDGEALFIMNGITRNEGFGDLHLFNRETYLATNNINPIKGVCCYRDPQFSPDGNYLLFAFQDITLGASSTTQLYYIPVGSLNTGTSYKPLPIPEFTNPREAPQAVLRPAAGP